MSCDDMYVCDVGVKLGTCQIKISMGKCDKFKTLEEYEKFMREHSVGKSQPPKTENNKQ